MTFQVGDLVRYFRAPGELGVVTMAHTTVTGAEVCEVVVVLDNKHPDRVGDKKYLSQDYWRKVEVPRRHLDQAIAAAIDLHQTYNES